MKNINIDNLGFFKEILIGIIIMVILFFMLWCVSPECKDVDYTAPTSYTEF